MHPFITIATKAARNAGQIILRAIDGLDRVTTESKGHHDFVTSVDKAAEQEIIYTIHKAYPSHAILAEESGASGEHGTTWIIDPLDGTLNFMHGFPHFCVSIAVVSQGRLEHGVIFDPLKNDLFWASRGQGAILNDRRLRVTQHPLVSDSLLAPGFPHAHKLENIDNAFEKIARVLPHVSGLRRAGSGALDLAYVAAGRFDGCWEMGLKPWDVAAGLLLVREAGGMITTLEGNLETKLEELIYAESLLAANPKLHKALLQLFQG